MVPTRIGKSCLSHNAILLGIQFNYLDQFTGGGGRYFTRQEEISEIVSVAPTFNCLKVFFKA